MLTRLSAAGIICAGLMLAGCGSTTSSGTSTSAPATPTATSTPANTADAYPLMSGFVGHFTGSWNNTTFSTTGSMTWDISADSAARTVTIKVTVSGHVFGGNAPPPETIVLSHLAQGTISGQSASFGAVSGTITPAGLLTISLSNIPGGAVQSVTTAGTLSNQKTINMQYTVSLIGGTKAMGTVSLTKS